MRHKALQRRMVDLRLQFILCGFFMIILLFPQSGLPWSGDDTSDQSIIEEADSRSKKASSIDSADVRAYEKLGWIFIEQSKYGAAIKNLRKAHALEPKDSGIQILLGRAYALDRKFPESIAIYKDVLDREPDNIWALYELGEVLSWKSELRKSLEIYERILEIDADNVGAKIGIARVKAYQGKWDQAASLYQNVLSSDPANIAARLGIAELLYWQGNYRASQREYEAVLAIAPQNRLAKEGWQQLQETVAPKFVNNVVLFVDSYDFERIQLKSSFKYRLFSKAFSQIEFSRWRFHQKGYATFYRNDYTLRLNQNLTRKLFAELNYTFNRLETDGQESSSYGALAKYDLWKNRFYLSYQHNPAVNSILSIEDHLSFDSYGLGVDLTLIQNFSFQGLFSISEYSDDNTEYLREAQLSYALFDHPALHLRYNYCFLGYESNSLTYWSPKNFERHSLLIEYSQPLSKELVFSMRGMGTFFTPDEETGSGIFVSLRFRPLSTIEMSLSASYYDAKTKAPWLGKSLKGHVRIRL